MMTLYERSRPRRELRPRSRIALLLLGATLVGPSVTRGVEAASQVVVWDTGSAFAERLEVESRTGWKAVPSDLLRLEADPSKASSDPGYYGREYSFRGDVVVENRTLAVVFWSAQGRVVLYVKAETGLPGSIAATNPNPGRKVAEVVPRQTKAQPARISRCRILQNASDQVTLEASFSAQNSAGWSAVFSFDKTEIVEIKPGENLKGISLLSKMDYGVVPSFVADDLIQGSADHPAGSTLCVPSETVFLGLLQGQDCMLAMTWPKGKQQLRLRLSGEAQGSRHIESVDYDNDAQSVYLAALRAPAIWHREELKPSYLEKDVAIQWRRPFPAKWKTQLSEENVRTTFAFRGGPGQIWRGVAGSYDYPVWFDGDRAFFHLSKKVPAKGESLIYFVEGEDTPVSVLTPVDVMKATLGRQLCDTLLDPAGRALRTHHRRGDVGVRRACTCGCTEAIQAVFEAGQEVEQRDQVNEATDDMLYFVQQHVERIDEYRRFADDVIQLLAAHERSSPELKPFLDHLKEVAQRIPQEYSVQKENMQSPAYAEELARRTLALTGRKDTNNLAAYQSLLDAWRAMGGAQDEVLARCHVTTRKLFQEAGYGCVHRPAAVVLAQEIRERCRRCLRNPDGYEIWPNY